MATFYNFVQAQNGRQVRINMDHVKSYVDEGDNCLMAMIDGTLYTIKQSAESIDALVSNNSRA